MSLEQEDSLRRKVREADERRAFKDSIQSVLSAKEAQDAIRTQREAEQARLRREKVAHEREQLSKRPRKGGSRIIGPVRHGRPEREW